jgi:hypothetical protein
VSDILGAPPVAADDANSEDINTFGRQEHEDRLEIGRGWAMRVLINNDLASPIEGRARGRVIHSFLLLQFDGWDLQYRYRL